jgi:hypothetical protein
VALIEWSAIIGLVLSLRRDLERLHPEFVTRMENGRSLERLEGEGIDTGNMTLGHSKLSATSREALSPADGAGDDRDPRGDDAGDDGKDDVEDDDVHEMGEQTFTRPARVKSNSRHVVIAEGGGVVLGSSPSDHTRPASDRRSVQPEAGVRARGPSRAEGEAKR